MALILLSTLLIPSLSHAIPLSFSAPACTKSLLDSTASSYLTAQTLGTPNTLTPLLSPSFTYLENNVNSTLTKSLLTKPLSIAHTRTIHDLLTCASYTELIAPNNTTPYVIGTQIRLIADGESGDWKIASLDTIATTTGAWLFNASKTLEYVLKETWTPLSASLQSPRSVLIAAGDAYLDMWSNSTADKAVPWGTPCVRLEGSAYTGTGKADDSCKPGIPSNHNQKPNTRRRYVVDEEMGSVSIFCVWEHMMNAADSHEFRLEGGKLRYVHTMTECGGKVCKL
ncbi:hypothetical protein BCR34DRAFT_475231 [Clohesyomyces aquaticus]|uniref:DUF8021 domain-containing protein n=1 Tax=Clohesyomyces aquaticus TaxID=1231657 RepID=A0A1Y2A3L9_9PLEO|nr:hypothetical protein BCR34DRAFT_475231 [Clohesyomyces aquaticus]